MMKKTGKKRILLAEYFSFIGGGQVVLLSLIKYLRPFYDVEVLLFTPGELEKELVRLKVKYTVLAAPKTPKFRYFWAMIPFINRVKEFLDKGKFDLIHANSFFAVKLTAHAAEKMGIPLLWHKHIIMDKEYNSYLGMQFRYFSKKVRKIICVSGAVARSVEKMGVAPEKLSIIHNGIEIPKSYYRSQRIKIRKKHKLGASFTVGAIGFFRRNKGFDLLLKAAKLVRERKRSIRFILVGRGEGGDLSHERELRDYVMDNDLMDTVIFAGFQNKLDYLPAFDLFCVPSPGEPFGLVTVEASAMGVPVLAFKTGGTMEIITKNVDGFLLSRVDHISLAEAVIRLSKDRKLLAKVSRNAVKNAKRRFDIKIMMHKIIGLFNETLA